MNAQLVKVGDNTYPVKYGFNALRLFCNASGIELQELEKLGESITFDYAINLVWAGLKDGARVEKQSFDLTVEDVADLLDQDPSLINQCVELFTASFIKPASGEKK